MVRVRVDWRSSCSFVGTILKWLSVPLCLPAVVALLYAESLVPFLLAIGVTFVLGIGLENLTEERTLGHREAFLMVALTWFSIALIGAIPFIAAGEGALANPVNALFESTSGITTTGATVITDFEIHAQSIMLWRQLIQWLGGLGILVLATAVLSELGVGGAQLMETETRTRDVHKLTPRIEETARLLSSLYVGLTVLQMALFYGLHIVGLAPDMTLFDAVAHPLTTVSTSGFSPQPLSIGAFSPVIQWVTIPFMALGATSFILLYFTLQGDTSRLRQSEEFRFYVFLLGLFTVVVSVLLVNDPDFDGTIEATLRHAAFQVVSIMTTTGYATVDFNVWSAAAKHMLFICMFIGGMAGSTTCSIKTLRWLVVIKAFRRDLFTATHPSVIRPVWLSGDAVDEETVRSIYAYTLISLVIFAAATVFLVLDASRVGPDIGEFDAMGAAAATFLNIGPGFGVAGPFGSYEPFSDSAKLVMVVLMWVGRIEILPVLVLLTPAYWRT
ncbi:TrkH family potassium uptake protein [Haladaptatus cibarius]|uniref:TrkH family potassium uptake protein n=1 Tax=Haladaptatus cibarius TaxID=453847 RepID=UPI000679D9DD|nr:TrkH family potassium uptake protein [Haladaptatus cibarius]